MSAGFDSRAAPFELRDGERLICFGDGLAQDCAELLARTGFDGALLLTTGRAREQVGAEVLDRVGDVIEVPDGPVAEAAAAIADRLDRSPLVALGGGRIVDVGKALAAVGELRCAAIPTSLAGSSFTPFHRLPVGRRAGQVRPALAICDPRLMTSGPAAFLAATAMNALAHAIEALYAPGANPVTEAVALDAIRRLGGDPADTVQRSLGALQAGWAVGITGLSLHHVVCQTIVAEAGTPHAETNAVMLGHTVGLMADRAPAAVEAVAAAIDTVDLPATLTELARGAEVNGLSELGMPPATLPSIANRSTERLAEIAVPGGPVGEDELLALLRAAL